MSAKFLKTTRKHTYCNIGRSLRRFVPGRLLVMRFLLHVGKGIHGLQRANRLRNYSVNNPLRCSLLDHGVCHCNLKG